VLDSAAFDRRIRELFEAFRPQTRYAVVLTDLFKLRPRVFEGGDVTWQHLAASCAVLGCFEQRRIGGRIYSDGGLLSVLPVWAARELGATRIIAVNALPQMPSAAVRTLVGGLRRISGFRPGLKDPPGTIRIEPRALLGSATDLLRWNRDKVGRWIEQGERDAADRKHFLSECFERQ
jgi:predicted acylesterase/phospholipase RssA